MREVDTQLTRDQQALNAYYNSWQTIWVEPVFYTLFVLSRQTVCGQHLM